MRRGLIVVKAAYDADAAVWFVEACDVEGVNAEAPSLEGLLQKLPDVVLDLLEEEGEGLDDVELPIELVAHASTRERCVKGYGKAVRTILIEAGCAFLRQGRGDHEIWPSPRVKGCRLAEGILSGGVLATPAGHGVWRASIRAAARKA